MAWTGITRRQHRRDGLRYASDLTAGGKLRGARRNRKMDARNHQAPDRARGFEVLPGRWVLEQAFAWLGRCRGLAKDFEATIASATAPILVARTRIVARRLARA